jgi:Tfp pilus assembly protein PilP
MKLRTTIFLLVMLTGTAWAQNPDVIQDTRSTLQNVQKKQVIDQNAVLAASGQAPAAKTSPSAKPVSTASSASKSKTPAKTVAAKSKATTAVPEAPKQEKEASAVAVEDKKEPVDPKNVAKTFSSVGRRDPFVSPVVSRSMVSTGCSSGKKCLAINQIMLTGIVKSDSGMIAVVVNAMNKAYFLRENDPVFNGYVVRITGDSIVFQETVQDNVGKTLTREVTKKISAPAV